MRLHSTGLLVSGFFIEPASLSYPAQLRIGSSLSLGLIHDVNSVVSIAWHTELHHAFLVAFAVPGSALSIGWESAGFFFTVSCLAWFTYRGPGNLYEVILLSRS